MSSATLIDRMIRTGHGEVGKGDSSDVGRTRDPTDFGVTGTRLGLRVLKRGSKRREGRASVLHRTNDNRGAISDRCVRALRLVPSAQL